MGDPLQRGQALGRSHTGPQPDEDHLRAIERRVGTAEEPLERGRLDPSGDDRSGAHGGVQSLRAPDGGQCGCPDNHQARRGDIDGGIASCSVTGDNGVADVLVQLGEGCRAEDDLVVRFERVPGQRRRADLGMCARQDDGHGLAVDLCIGE
jgi:hypothetical protein